MTTNSFGQDDLPSRSSFILSRWSLVTAFVLLATTVLYSATGSAPTDSAMGQEFVRLMVAVRNPGLIRLQTAVESLFWLMLGGTLILYAGLFSRRSPILSTFVAACGVGQLASSLGAFLGGDVGDIAARYAAASPSQQAILLESFLELQRVIGPYYAVGSLLTGVGFLLAGWAAWRLTRFPRWLAAWLAITGLFGFVFFIMLAAGLPRSTGSLVILPDTIVIIGLNAAIAVAFWRPETLVARLSSRAEATM